MFKPGDKVVLDYEDGPNVRTYGTVVDGEPFYPHCCRVLEDDTGKVSEWHKGRVMLTDIVESPLYKALKED